MNTKYARTGWTALMVLALLVSFTGVALAFDSPGVPGGTGPDTITWTGQGSTDGALTSVECDGDTPAGTMLWILTMDGGAVSNNPTLFLGGSGSGSYTGTQFGNEWHIFTPYFAPDTATLTAYANFNVSDTGNGQWVLTISHGCPGGKLDPAVTTEVHLDDESVVSEPLPLGSVVHDSATVTGTGDVPTGLVDFFFFDNGVECPDEGAGDGTAFGSVELDGSGVAHPSDSTDPLEAGSYAFKAYYEGDANYNPGWGDCEPFTVEKGDSAVSTEVHDPDHTDITDGSVYVGTAVHDSSSVVGNPPTPIDPTGDVTYSLYGSSDCTGDLVALDLNGATITNPETVAVGTESSEVLLPVGSYGYLVSYSGDDNYWPYTADATTDCEPFEVEIIPTTTTTVVHDPLHNPVTGITAGIPVHDNASVTPNPEPAITLPMTGTVTFYFFNNSSCSGTVPGEEVAVGTESTPKSLNPGNYSYLAVYSGDANYAGSTGECEPFTVFTARLTPGYWKTHSAQTTALLPIRLGNYVLSGTEFYWVNTFAKATAVFNAMNCGNAATNSKSAVGCLAGHLLATKLNLANGTNPCLAITTAVTNADAFLTNPVHYRGPAFTYTLTGTQRSTAIGIKNTLDSYNNGGVCP